ncbi:MAG: aspartate 1-decarboxylase [Clostridia bacterium]|nr:aspartate 1-decarboxylase [Clostridia bacterium]
MFINLMKSKIHRARVTEANLNYVGSITIDENLMDAADIMKNEKVQIVNNNNGNRFETYVIPGERGSGMICLNGAAARLVHPGDVIIIISYGLFDRKEASEFVPRIIFVNDKNTIVDIKNAEEHGQIINYDHN